jgi:hypothetical protein
MASAPERRHRRAALAAAVLGFFVVALYVQAVKVALPGIRADLGGGQHDPSPGHPPISLTTLRRIRS